MVVDLVFVHGQDFLFPHPVFSEKAWQFGVMLGLLGLALLALSRGRRPPHRQFPWILPVPKIVVFGFCLGLLLIQFRISIFVVWFVAASIATSVLVWPFILKMTNRRHRRMSSATPKAQT
jgi:sorbitol-specific phosphotransferase system component IIC